MSLKTRCIETTTNSDGSIYGKYSIEPLEKGYGTTIGNSLRRVLLSSLEGAAATSLRIEGITHEYTSIPGIKEDVIDIMLNLKGLVIKLEDDEPKTLRIDVSEAGAVTANAIERPAGVKIINPDWHICTVAEGGDFHAEIIVEKGYGYVMATETKESQQESPVDMITLDANFMPITRVSYSVENTRVGEVIDYDKLILEIWSNGSIETNTALSQASNILIENFSAIADQTGEANFLTGSQFEEEKKEEVTTIAIEDLELSVRAYNCLKRASINNMQELLEKSQYDLLHIKNFGKKSADEVIERLKVFKLDLAPNPEGFEVEA